MPSGFRFESINSQFKISELPVPFCLALRKKKKNKNEHFLLFSPNETRCKLSSLSVRKFKKRKGNEKKSSLRTSSLVTVLFLSLSDTSTRFCLNNPFDRGSMPAAPYPLIRISRLRASQSALPTDYRLLSAVSIQFRARDVSRLSFLHKHKNRIRSSV